MNTKIYRELFKVYPDNEVKTFKDLDAFKVKEN